MTTTVASGLRPRRPFTLTERRKLKRFVLPLLTLALLATPAVGQTTSAYTSWDPGQPTPYSWVRLDLLLKMDAAKIEDTIVHEGTHVRQMLRYGSQEAWMRAFRRGGKSFRVAMEAEALCAVARVAFARGDFPTVADAVYHYAGDLAYAYDFGLTRAQAIGLISIPCKLD